MERLDQRFEFGDLSSGGVLGSVPPLRSEKSNRVVASRVPQFATCQEVVVDEGLQRQELHRRYAKLLQVVDDNRWCETKIRAAQFRWQFGMQDGETLEMCFVNDRLAPGRLRASVVFPFE